MSEPVHDLPGPAETVADQSQVAPTTTPALPGPRGADRDTIELVFKGVSALGAILLGVAGLWFQFAATTQQHRLSDSQTTARTYLPMLQSLTALDVVLTRVSGSYLWPDTSDAIDKQREGLGTDLCFLADGLVKPESLNTVDLLSAQGNAAGRSNGRYVSLRLDDGVHLLSAVLRNEPLFRGYYRERPRTQVDIDRGYFHFATPQGQDIDWVRLSSRDAALIDAWLDRKPLTVDSLYHEIDLSWIAEDIHTKVQSQILRTLSAHPSLAPDYVQIRTDIQKAQDQILGEAVAP
jgi:hypothetical protein